MTGVLIKNSPSFNIVPKDCEDLYMHHFEILAEHWGFFLPYFFFEIDDAFRTLGWHMPWFPLNTDGIDFAGRNATFSHIKITNFDDAIVAKPSHRGDNRLTNCTTDILVENINVTYSVGMSIGSVPPNDNHTCIKDVVFRNINFTSPLKAIYIKTNPGDSGSGEIRNITYENFNIKDPIWWNIYIGPQ